MAKKHATVSRRGGRRSLSQAAKQKREEQILALRRKGYSHKEISKRLDLTCSVVSHVVHQLIREGKVADSRSLSDDERIRREEQIVKLREKGYSNKEIAEGLGLSVATVETTASKLVQAGRIDPRPPGPSSKIAWRDLKDEGTRNLIAMVQRRATLQAIGEAFEISLEYARHLIAQIAKEHGERVFDSDEPLRTAPEAADELNTTSVIIHTICAAGEVPCQKRGSGKKSTWLIDEVGMKALREHPLITKERTCVVCGAIFIHNGTCAATCSGKCSEEYEKQRMKSYVDQQPTADSLQGWRKELWQQLQTHRIPKEERWLTVSEAAQYTGLNNGHINWLRRRNVVTIRRDPARKNRGKPVALYAASEMEIVRQVYEEYASQDD